MTSAVSLQDVSCVFKSGGTAVHAVSNVSLEVKEGEFFTLLGPSGSGKTTCLRMVGGFTLPTSGSIRLYGEDVSQLPPYSRPVNTVFQDYALFPHMTVSENVAYSLMIRGIDKPTRQKRAQALLETVQLPDVGARKPTQLSGGQRQRVALARALINEPKVLLLDEPLGALDLKLREQMQVELKQLQRRLGITFIFVTHDQHEALSMSDRIGIFNKGRIEQVASPSDLYRYPATRFVAEFVGSANLLEGEQAKQFAAARALMIRPEMIHCAAGDQAHHGAGPGCSVKGEVKDIQFFGSFSRLQVQPAGGLAPLLADVSAMQAQPLPTLGQAVTLSWPQEAMHVIEAA
jgi:putative spermidine/putrescine transport system ATP-binding protein